MKKAIFITFVAAMFCYAAATVNSRNQASHDGGNVYGAAKAGKDSAKKNGFTRKAHAEDGQFAALREPPSRNATSDEKEPLKIMLATRRDGTATDANERESPWRPATIGAINSHLLEDFNGDYEDITGKGIIAAIFDEGSVYAEHVEFQLEGDSTKTRVTLKSTEPHMFHPTHVAATMAAIGGKKHGVKGMAPGLSLWSYHFDNDLENLEGVARGSEAVHLSNHSYTTFGGWELDNRTSIGWRWHGNTEHSELEDSKFGKYGERSKRVDEIIHNSSKLIAFFAAGNERAPLPESGSGQAFFHQVKVGEIWQDSNELRQLDNFDREGLDTILAYCAAKNVICVGAIDGGGAQVRNSVGNVNPISSEPYSSWGPADDGRIKPDLVANGHAILSASNTAKDAYRKESGTSMASPVAAGIGALMVQLLQRERPQLMDYSAAVIKAVLIHTATDDNQLPGPDPKFGWGSINAFDAGRVIGRKEGGMFLHYIKVHEGLSDQQVDEIEFNDTGKPIRATLVWIDPPGDENKGGLDDATPSLVNDLDLILEAPDGQLYHPYSFDLKKLKSSSDKIPDLIKGEANRVDNVEVVDASPREGKWKVRVTATSLKQGPTQRFALVVSGLRE